MPDEPLHIILCVFGKNSDSFIIHAIIYHKFYGVWIFSMFLHGYREVSAPGLWVNPNCYHSYGAEENVVATLYGSAASVPCGALWLDYIIRLFSHVGNVFAVLLPEYFHLKLSERQPLP